MKKRGRKAADADNPINNVISVKVSKEDIEKLKICQEKLNASRGQIIRMGIDQVYAKIKE